MGERLDRTQEVAGSSPASSTSSFLPLSPSVRTARGIEDETDVRDVIQLLRLNYDRVVTRYGVPAEASKAEPPA